MFGKDFWNRKDKCLKKKLFENEILDYFNKFCGEIEKIKYVREFVRFREGDIGKMFNFW